MQENEPMTEEPGSVSSSRKSIYKKNKLSFLYVDDDPIDTWLAVSVLKMTGIADEVMTVSNGASGIQVIHSYVEKNLKFPEVIMVDLQMPLMNGFEFIQLVEDIPLYSADKTTLILITEGLDEMDIKKIDYLKINHVLLKPLVKEELLRIIQ